ncbi:MAG: MBL fold metallo-hydrolase [Methanobacteriota archaeon]|nr:MAG: MBL fold metallo-hydrolase [Euryarchaeota archaeon]
MGVTKITCYGGVAQIGGNKILVEDRDARIWLDMGATFGFGSEFFVEYLTARKRFGLRDYFALGLLPKLPGLYSPEMLAPASFDYEPPRFSGVFISHIHFDHTNHLQFLDPSIPVHLGAGTKIILDSWQTTATQMDLGDHDYRPFRTGQSVSADGVDTEPVHVDHSAPAAYGFLLHTSDGAIAYTGDLRQHGPHAEMTRDFIAAAAAAKPVCLITEGTRVAPVDPRKNLSEAQVKERSIATAQRAKGKIVIATFYPRDVDRMRTFLEVAKEVERKVVLQPKAAHLLLSLAADRRIQIPDVLRDPEILVYDRQMIAPKVWERNLLAQLRSKVVTSEYVHQHQGEILVQLDFETLPELIDIKPAPGSPFIHSKSEPIEENDEVEATLRNWIRFFQLRRHQFHASGHMSEREIADMVKEIAPKIVIPVHTEHPERFTRFAPHVVQPVREAPIPLTG